MPIIDQRGRVFGRINLVDAAIVLLLVLMMPVAYGAYLLFRDPPPRLVAIAPTAFAQGPNLQVEIRGENLRPYMRASFGRNQGLSFLFQSPAQAIVRLPDLDPGKYDVVLYDYAQEVSRLKDGLTILPTAAPPQANVIVTGAFTGMSPEQSARITTGARFPPEGEARAVVLSALRGQPGVARVQVGPATFPLATPGQQDVPAKLALRCGLTTGPDGILHCYLDGVTLAPDANIRLPGPDAITYVYRVSDVHSADQSRELVVHARFPVRPGIEFPIAKGDTDVGARAFPSDTPAAVVTVSRSGAAIDVTLKIEAEQTPVGWVYKGKTLKAGSVISFETIAYTMDGVVTSVELPPLKP